MTLADFPPLDHADAHLAVARLAKIVIAANRMTVVDFLKWCPDMIAARKRPCRLRLRPLFLDFAAIRIGRPPLLARVKESAEKSGLKHQSFLG